jgi:hypothetical protein
MNAELRRTELPAPQAVETRLAARLAGAVAEQAEQLPRDIAERLRVGREQAVLRARETRSARQDAAAPATAVVGLSRGAALLGRPVPWWQRAASVLPLVVLVVGLLAVQRFSEREQVLAAAEVDTMLLTDDLPPDAYADPGFGEFLRSPPP